MRMKEESETTSLKLNIKKTKIMASDPIISWQIEGEKVEVVTEFLFLGSKITVDGECSHESFPVVTYGCESWTVKKVGQ